MNKRSELLFGLLAIIIAVLAWIFPFNPIGNSPLSQNKQATEISNESTVNSNVLPSMAPSQIVTTVDQFQWFERIQHYPMIPGVGLAGIKISDSEESVLSLLGMPINGVNQVRASGNEILLDNSQNSGEIVWYALKYEKDQIFLGIYTHRDTRTVISFRLIDKNFNQDKFLPSYNGVTIGSQVSELIRLYGDPIHKDEHNSCPFSDDRATTYYYDGISFVVCEVNQLIYGIDIP